MPHEKAKKFTRHDEKSICQLAQTHFPSERRVMTFFFLFFWRPPCPYPVLRHCAVVKPIFFGHHYSGHDPEHWPVANPYMVNAALQLKRLPTPGIEYLRSSYMQLFVGKG